MKTLTLRSPLELAPAAPPAAQFAVRRSDTVRIRDSRTEQSASRRHELDWLRAFAVLGLIPFHAAVIFATGSGDYVKSSQTSVLMNIFASFITFWGIPLLFLIAGAAARFAVGGRRPRQYVIARLTRLGIPFIFGILIIVPVQVYVGTLTGPGPQLSYPAFYLRYLSQWANILHGTFPTAHAEWIGHLWFIPPLLLFSLLALPFSRLLRVPWCAALFERAVVVSSGWRVLFAFGLPIALGQYLLRIGVAQPLSLDFQFSDSWVGFFSYLIFFLYGYVIYADARLTRDVRRYGPIALGLAVTSWIVFEIVVRSHHAPAYDYSLVSALFVLLLSYTSWFWVMALLGLGMRYLNRSGRLLDYLNEATFPVYVLHMPVLTIVAFYAVHWHINLLGDYLAIVAITVLVTLLIYDLVVRRVGVLRFLFGLRVSAPSRHTVKEPIGPAQSEQSRAANTDESERNLALLFRNRSERYANLLRWREKVDGVWRSATGSENRALVNEIISGLDALGATQGDRIGILSGTRWEWMAADWAILGLGAVTVTLYPSQVPEMLAVMIADSGARFVFVENAQQRNKLQSVRSRMPELCKVIVFDAADTDSDPSSDWALSLDQLRQLSPRTPAQADAFAAMRARRIQPDDMATIVYTSGTTGEPKGAVLTHANLLAQVAGARTMLNTIHAGMVDLLFLPLAHVLGREEHLLTLDRGAETVIARSLDHLAEDIREARPHILLSVPRVYEKAYAAILAQVAASNSFRRALFQLAVSIGRKALSYREQQSRSPLALRAGSALANRLVFRRIRAAFGDRFEFAVTGGAPLDQEILRFFHIAGLRLLEGWGLTETSGALTVNTLDAYRLGTVGLLYPGHALRVAPDGELLVQGPCVFRGYYNNPTATAEAIDAEGWFHTGDLGAVDGDGFVTILDRKKDLIATSGGKKIAPQRVENLLKSIPLISQAAVFGDRKPYLVALLTLDTSAVQRWASANGVNMRSDADVATNPRLTGYLSERVADVNRQLASFETVKRFAVLSSDFTVANGLLTATQKIRRREIFSAYHDEIERLYQSSAASTMESEQHRPRSA